MRDDPSPGDAPSAAGSVRTWASPAVSLAAGLLLGSGVLLLAVLLRFYLAPDYQDFTGLYMGGVVARAGAWADLYPMPTPGAVRQPGAPDASSMRPGYARLAAAHGVPDSIRFVQAPAVAVAFSPLALLPLRTAHLVWTLLSVVLAIVVAWQAGAVFARLTGRPTILRGAIVLLVAASPTMYQACRMGQLSTLIGAGFGLAVLGLSAPERTGTATGLGLALASVKLAGGVLAPVAVAMGRWRTLLCAAGLGLGPAVVSVVLTGVAPWERWLQDIVPTLTRTHPWSANQSLVGLLARVWADPLPAGVQVALHAAAAGALLALLGLIVTRARTAWHHEATVFAACAALLGWLHVFSPIFWSHYSVYLFPLWGWLAWEGTRSRRVGVLVLLVFALAWAPAGSLTAMAQRLPEPVRTHMLGSALLTLGIAVRRLVHPLPPRGAPRRSPSATTGTTPR